MGTFRNIELPSGLSADRWPVLVYTAPPAIDDVSFKAVVDAMATIRGLGEPHALVLDVRISSGISPAQRRMITTAMPGDEAQRSATCGLAMVFTSRFMASLLTAIFWVKRPAYEVKVFSDVDHAIAWASDQVARARPSDQARL